MSLTNDDVKYIAQLSSLSISDEEIEATKNELNDILDYVQKLNEVDTNNVEPTSHVHGAVNAFREDIVKSSLKLEDIEKNAPDFNEAGFRVPRII